MKKLTISLISFSLGALTATICLSVFWIKQLPGESEKWITNESVQLENGAMLPVGTELAVKRRYPELDTVWLTLLVAAEESESSKFEKRLDPVEGYVALWVEN